MFSRGGRGEDGGLFSVVIAVIALLALLGNSKRARRQRVRRVRFDGERRRVDDAVLAHRRLPDVHGSDVAPFQHRGGARPPASVFQLHVLPGAWCGAGFLGLAAHRARERRGQGAAPALRPTRCSRRPPNRNRRRWAFQRDRRPDSRQSPHPGAAAPAPRAAIKPEPVKTTRKPFPDPVKNPADYRNRAIGYRRRIQSLIKSRRRGPLADLMAAILPNAGGVGGSAWGNWPTGWSTSRPTS